MTIEYLGIRSLAARFGTVPATLRSELRPRLRAAGQHILDDMKQRASYSSRIPGATFMSVSFSARGGGVKFRVNAKKAPHARVLERGNLGGRAALFRHPVFGDMDNWVTQPTRPFFFPAVSAGRGQVRKNISDAVRASLREVSR